MKSYFNLKNLFNPLKYSVKFFKKITLLSILEGCLFCVVFIMRSKFVWVDYITNNTFDLRIFNAQVVIFLILSLILGILLEYLAIHNSIYFNRIGNLSKINSKPFIFYLKKSILIFFIILSFEYNNLVIFTNPSYPAFDGMDPTNIILNLIFFKPFPVINDLFKFHLTFNDGSAFLMICLVASVTIFSHILEIIYLDSIIETEDKNNG